MPPLEDLPIIRDKDPEELAALKQGGQKVWRCRICGHVHYAAEPPKACPYCFFPGTAFKQM